MAAGTQSLIVGWAQPLHWSVAGALIGGIVLWLLFCFNHSLGVSTGFENFCALWSDRPYFKRRVLHGSGMWRLPFWVGLILGGALSRLLAGDWSPTWALGMWDAQIGGGQEVKVVWMLVGGCLIGFGTRLAGGCTSGHGIFGVSNFERASIVSTISFMVAGVLTTLFVYKVLPGWW